MSEDEKKSSAQRAEDEIARRMAGDLMPKQPEPERKYKGRDWWREDYKRYGGTGGGQGRLFDEDGVYGGGLGRSDHGNWDSYGKGLERTDWAKGDSVDDVMPAKSKKWVDPSLPHWIRTNIDSLKSVLRRAGEGERPMRPDEVTSLVTYVMLAFGDLMEKSGGLIFMTGARKAVREAFEANIDSICIVKGGQTRVLQTGEVVPPRRYTGAVGEQLLADAMAAVGIDDEDAVIGITEYLREHGARLMAEEDVQEELAEAEGQIAKLQYKLDAYDLEMPKAPARKEWEPPAWTHGVTSKEELVGSSIPVLKPISATVSKSSIGRTMEQELAAGAVVTPPVADEAGAEAPEPQVEGGSIFDDDGDDDGGFMSPPPSR